MIFKTIFYIFISLFYLIYQGLIYVHATRASREMERLALISMSVMTTHVTKTPHVGTLSAVTHVHVTLGIPVMAKTVLISMSANLTHVIRMPHVRIQSEAIFAHVMQDFLVMVNHVKT